MLSSARNDMKLWLTRSDRNEMKCGLPSSVDNDVKVRPLLFAEKTIRLHFLPYEITAI